MKARATLLPISHLRKLRSGEHRIFLGAPLGRRAGYVEQAGGSRGHPPTCLAGLSEVGLASPSVDGFAGNALLRCPVCLDDPSPLPPAPMAPFLLPWCFLPSQPSAPPHVGVVKRVGSTARLGGPKPRAQLPKLPPGADAQGHSSFLEGTGKGWGGRGSAAVLLCAQAPQLWREQASQGRASRTTQKLPQQPVPAASRPARPHPAPH